MLPSAVPVGTQYWKYHVSEGGGIRISMSSDDGDAVITITLEDGGLGDDDGECNGVIVDSCGPGVPSEAAGIDVIVPPQETLIDITTEIKSDGTVIEGEQFGWETGNGNLLNNPPLSPGEAVGSIKYDDKMISSNGTTEFTKNFGVNTNVTPNLAVTKAIGYKSGDLGSLSYAEQVGMHYFGASPHDV
jgi:hypothetical protein